MHHTNNALTIIRNKWPHEYTGLTPIPIPVDRWQLAKLRWRASAQDGRDFGFELETPLYHGDAVWVNYSGVYTIEQMAEPVLIVALTASPTSARLAWSVGNLHQPLQVTDSEMIAADDPALRQLFDQQGIQFSQENRVFQPITTVIGHHLHHHHHHAHDHHA